MGLEVGAVGVVEFINHIQSPIEGSLGAFEVISDHRRNRKTVPRVANGWCQHRGHRQGAEALMQLKPTVNGAGHGNR